MSDNESITDGIGGSFEIYKAEGDVLFKHGEYKKALQSYTVALDQREGDKNCLVARSQCYLHLGDADRGLADAEKTLEDDPSYIKGILQRAESYYQKGQFEYALMHYHKGNKLRPEKQAFRLGIQKSQEAIDNSIGDSSGIKLSKTGDLSYFYAEQQKSAKGQQQKRAGYTRPGSRERKKQQKRRKEGQDQKTVKQLLGDLYADKEYLELLLKETEAAGNQSETNKDVHTLAEDCLNYLDTRTQFWQQQKPMYSRKNDKKHKEKRQKGDQKDISEWVLMRLNKIDDEQAEGHYEESLKLAKRTLKEVDKWSDEDLPNRPEVVANLHSCHGNAYLEMGDFMNALKHHTTDNEIGEQHDIDESKSRSLDNIGRVHARMGNYEKAIEVWEKKQPLVKSALECTWLYHEIGRCHLELKNYDTAKEFGNKSLDAADEASDEVWQLNATVLVAQCEVKLKDNQAAIDSFEKALEMAKVQRDTAAESAIRKAIEDVNQRIVDDIKDGQEGEGQKAIEDNEEKKSDHTSSDKDKDMTDDLTEKDIRDQIKLGIHEKDEKSEYQDIKDEITDNQEESFYDTDQNYDKKSEHSNGPKNEDNLGEHDIRAKILAGQNRDANSDNKTKEDDTHIISKDDKNSNHDLKMDNQGSNLDTKDIRDEIWMGQNQSEGFDKDYEYDFEGTKSKFEETSKETEDEKEKKNETDKEKEKTEEEKDKIEEEQQETK